MTALNPVFTSAIRSPKRCSSTARAHAPRRARSAIELLDAVQHSRRRARASRDYPHQLSGGMRQRVHDRDRARLPAAARHRRRADDGARRHDPGADPRPAARDASSGSTWRCCSSRTTSASSPRWPTASRSCTRAGSSRRRRSRDCFATRSTPTRAGCWRRFPAATPGTRLQRDRGHRAAARRSCRRAARSSRAARSLRAVPTAPRRLRGARSA